MQIADLGRPVEYQASFAGLGGTDRIPFAFCGGEASLDKSNQSVLPLNTLGQRVLACRLERGMTQQEAASRIGLSQSQISGLENDKYASSVLTPQLAALFGVRVLWLAEDHLPDFAVQVARGLAKLPPEQQQCCDFELTCNVAASAATSLFAQ